MARPNQVRIDPETYGRLEAEAKKAGTTVTEQVRRRLAASLDFDATAGEHPPLAELQGLVAELCIQLPLDTDGQWYADPFAFEAFKAGVNALLDAMRPAGPVQPPKRDGRVFGIDDPVALGRAYAGMLRRMKETGDKP